MGSYTGGHIALPTLWNHSRQSHLMSLHAGFLRMPSNSQQETSTYHSYEFCGCPLGLLHAKDSTQGLEQEVEKCSDWEGIVKKERDH
ncbi:hypothetical protein E2C01_005772 [Portunus trituberculatus]|uniref:Uncharacterized protein n=1 Tax=Portunus trituberculatus TaxID=210409 RepID=A0A5B7D019_PORTR|nr:hypothetical protein [Portunus trituberculatus]